MPLKNYYILLKEQNVIMKETATVKLSSFFVYSTLYIRALEVSETSEMKVRNMNIKVR